MPKPKLYLVSNKQIKRLYEMFYVFLDTGEVMEYDMSQCTIYDGDEIVEVVRKDERDVFHKRFIVRMRFIRLPLSTLKSPIQPVA